MALNAGVDVIMLSEKKFVNVLKVLDAECKKNPSFAQKVFDAEKKVIQYKINAGILSLKPDSERANSYNVHERSQIEQRGSEKERFAEFERVWKSYRENFK